MIVADASAVAELVIRGPTWRALAARLLAPGEEIHAPHLLDLEVASVLRRCVLAGSVSVDDAEVAQRIVHDLPLVRHPHDVLMPRVWALRGNLTPYDAAYVALAEALGAPLLTLDAGLAAAPVKTATVELVAR